MEMESIARTIGSDFDFIKGMGIDLNYYLGKIYYESQQ